jgi:hypothetical protein
MNIKKLKQMYLNIERVYANLNAHDLAVQQQSDEPDGVFLPRIEAIEPEPSKISKHLITR